MLNISAIAVGVFSTDNAFAADKNALGKIPTAFGPVFVLIFYHLKDYDERKTLA